MREKELRGERVVGGVEGCWRVNVDNARGGDKKIWNVTLVRRGTAVSVPPERRAKGEREHLLPTRKGGREGEKGRNGGEVSSVASGGEGEGVALREGRGGAHGACGGKLKV